MKTPFTDEEQEVMDLIVQAYENYIQIEPMHPDHIREFVDGIHKCQTVLKSRVVTRDYPDIFYNATLKNSE